MSVADGNVEVAMTGGSVSSLMVSLAGAALRCAHPLMPTADDRIADPMRPRPAQLPAWERSIFDRTLLDTQKSILHVSGQVSTAKPGRERPSQGRPQVASDLLDLHGPVLVQGKIRSPQTSIGRAIPIPTPVFGDAKTVACEATARQSFSVQP